MYKIFTPVWRIVGEFITLGTLYNDMGIDCMEINGIQGQTTPDSGPEARPGGFRGSHFGGGSLFYLLYPENTPNV